MALKVFDGQTENGFSLPFSHSRRLGVLTLAGTFDGGTVVIQGKGPDGQYRDLSGGERPAEAMMHFLDFPAFLGRLELRGAGPGTDITVWYENPAEG